MRIWRVKTARYRAFCARTFGGRRYAMTRCRAVCGATIGLAALAMTPALAQAPKVGDPPEAKNMRLVGWNDLQTRSAYQPIIHKYGNRYIAFVGHHGGTEAV